MMNAQRVQVNIIGLYVALRNGAGETLLLDPLERVLGTESEMVQKIRRQLGDAASTSKRKDVAFIGKEQVLHYKNQFKGFCRNCGKQGHKSFEYRSSSGARDIDHVVKTKVSSKATTRRDLYETAGIGSEHPSFSRPQKEAKRLALQLNFKQTKGFLSKPGLVSF